MLDIIFISYDEPNADENWSVLKSLVPYAKRVHGVKGIPQAHIEASKKVSTNYFFTVDGDNEVLESFDWEEIYDFHRQEQRIHVWRCKNSVNGLIYGYGGIKLWPKNHVENIKEYSIDFTTSVAKSAKHGFKAQREVASITKFNTSPYNAWKSGFRECTKLSGDIIHNQDQKTKKWLDIWMSVGADVDYGYYTILGSRMGALYSIEHDDNLNLINDFEWCNEKFKNLVCDDSDVLELINIYGNILNGHGIEVSLLNPEESKIAKDNINDF